MHCEIRLLCNVYYFFSSYLADLLMPLSSEHGNWSPLVLGAFYKRSNFFLKQHLQMQIQWRTLVNHNCGKYFGTIKDYYPWYHVWRTTYFRQKWNWFFFQILKGKMYWKLTFWAEKGCQIASVQQLKQQLIAVTNWWTRLQGHPATCVQLWEAWNLLHSTSKIKTKTMR